MRPRFACPALLLTALTIFQPLYGWGPEGHRIVAAIAERRLNNKAKAAVAAILPTGATLESIASWADEVRPQRRETGPWHYIDIPTDVARGDWTKYCPKAGCVPRALAAQIAILKNAATPREQRDEALRFVVHFVGDMHQPLHVGERGDQGGNKVRVTLLDHPTNLHSAWDSGLLKLWFAADPEAETKLLEGAPKAERAAITAGTIEDWMWESQAVAGKNVYGPLDECQCTTLDAAYLAQAEPVLRRQLLRGGERLGRVLNETLGE
jgi:hypothetical protein